MADKKILRTDVHVENKGKPIVLEAGTELPTWASSLVTNPKAFVPEEAHEAEETDTES